MHVHQIQLLKYGEQVFESATLLLLGRFSNVPREVCVSDTSYFAVIDSILSTMCCQDLTFLAHLEALRIMIEPSFFTLCFFIVLLLCVLTEIKAAAPLYLVSLRTR